jgi:hypothetical protein
MEVNISSRMVPVTGSNVIQFLYMNKKLNWSRIILITGIILFFIGTIDPLEGSLLIMLGNGLMVLSAYLTKQRHRKIFLSTFIMIIIGVFFLFYFSSLGGFGGTSTLSWWWGLFILPYPIGWLMVIILLIIKVVKKPKQEVLSK